jgi:hypothetical protein
MGPTRGGGSFPTLTCRDFGSLEKTNDSKISATSTYRAIIGLFYSSDVLLYFLAVDALSSACMPVN